MCTTSKKVCSECEHFNRYKSLGKKPCKKGYCDKLSIGTIQVMAYYECIFEFRDKPAAGR